jgi:putative ABC transport system permease protein
MGIALTGARFPDGASLQEFQRQLLERLQAVPGAQAIGAANILPMRGNSSRLYSIPDQAPPEAGREPSVSVRFVTPGYLEALNITSTAGRSFTMSDVQNAPRVAVINARMAARHWPEASPIGHNIRIGGVDHEVVGLVSDTRDFGPDDEAAPMVYMPMLQNEVRNINLIVHTTEAPAAVANAIREAVRSLDPEQPVHDVSTLRAILEDEVGGSLAMTKVLGSLGVVAFILAALGVYGVMAYSVAQRRQELGIRMALGAQRRNVLSLVFRRGVLITGSGIGIGLLLALSATRALSFFLFGVSPFDPVAFVSVPLMLGLTGMVASALPALRAARVDPLIALRTD